MGRGQSNTSPAPSPSRPRFPVRTCHRKGCGRKFCPRSWNQRYCREPDCLRLLHRWQAAKRQRERRRQAEKRRQHAAAERTRRQRQRAARKSAAGAAASRPLVAAVGTAGRAWSRSQPRFQDFCDRPGCYDPLPSSRRGPVQYCGAGCAQAQRRVEDRERKFMARQQKAAARRAEERQQASVGKAWPSPRTNTVEATRRFGVVPGGSRDCVQTSAPPPDGALSFARRMELLSFSEEVSQDDFETSPGSRPRAPPSG